MVQMAYTCSVYGTPQHCSQRKFYCIQVLKIGGGKNIIPYEKVMKKNYAWYLGWSATLSHSNWNDCKYPPTRFSGWCYALTEYCVLNYNGEMLLRTWLKIKEICETLLLIKIGNDISIFNKGELSIRYDSNERNTYAEAMVYSVSEFEIYTSIKLNL